MATKETFKLELEVQQALSSINGLKTAVKGLIGVIAVDQILDFGRAIIDASKQFQTMRNQLTLVTQGTADLDRVMETLTATANQNRTSFAATVDLFTKLRISTDALGISEQRVIDVTSKLSQALQVAGADTATTNSVIRQFGQAMASGTVRGDEFNSLVEGLGPALAIMARESGITVGRLREMSQAGELTAEVMFKLLENSRSLSAAFNNMQPTIAQLETALGDAFDRALVKIGEATGITGAYESVIKSLTRTLDQVSGTASALVNQTPGQIFEKVAEDSLTAEKAIEEVNRRIDETTKAIIATKGLAQTPELLNYIKELESLRAILEQVQAIQIRASERTKAELKAQEEQQKRINQVLKDQGITSDRIRSITSELAKIDFSSPYEKAKARLDEAVENLDKLRRTQRALLEEGLPTDQFVDLDGAIKTAETAVSKLRAEVQRLNELTGFDKFYQDLIKNAEDSVTTFDYATAATERLINELLDGKISAEAFAYAMESVRNILQKTTDDADRITDIVDNYTQALKDSTENLQQEFDQLNMNELDRDISRIETKLKRNLQRTVKELQDQLKQNPQQADMIQKQIDEITKATDQAIAQQRKLAENSYKHQREFSTGWRRAMDDYVNAATNAARQAERIFSKATQGMEDLIVNFAKTGKFEWKQFVASMLEELLRAQIQQIFASLIGGMRGQMNNAGPSSPLGGIASLLGGGLESITRGVGSIFGSTQGDGGFWDKISGGISSLFGNSSSSSASTRGSSPSNPLYVTQAGGGFVGGGFGSTTGGAAQTGDGFFGTIGKAASSIWTGIKNVGSTVFEGVKSIGSGIWNAAKSVGNLFAGFFANGGMIPAGKFGVVGEAGPEFVSGPATVTPMSGSTNVTYNINAVDAMSFKQLLAQDPSFIYGLTLQGSKSVASRR